MPWYATIYEPWPVEAMTVESPIGQYGSFVWARNLRNAKSIARRRRIGETIAHVHQKNRRPFPYPVPSEMARRRRLTKAQKVEFLHAVSFLSFLLMQSTGAPVHAVLGDEGVLHQAIHWAQIGFPSRKAMTGMLQYLERRVPGYLPE